MNNNIAALRKAQAETLAELTKTKAELAKLTPPKKKKRERKSRKKK
jgi:hypothetical protein